jgi:ribonucleoside-diphosphate reductase alpha chain
MPSEKEEQGKQVQGDRRKRLPDERKSITHKFTIGNHEGYITVGMFEDGRPGEIFVKMAKEGATLSGLMDSFAIAMSMALQYGVPLKVLVEKFSYTRFEPSGYTQNPDIPYAKSIMDYMFRWLGKKFLGAVPETVQPWVSVNPSPPPPPPPPSKVSMKQAGTGSPCQICGNLMQQTAESLYICASCGYRSDHG